MICFFTKHILNPEQLSLYHNRHNNLVDPTYAILVTVIIDFYRWRIRNVGAKWCICHMCWITNRIVLMVRANSATPLDLMLEKFSCPLDLMWQKFCKTPWSGGSCCRNSAAPWYHAAEILQEPSMSCCRNSARPLELMLQKFCKTFDRMLQ